VETEGIKDGELKSREGLAENEKKAEKSDEVVEIPKEGMVCG
jgi:hypothetical protein